MSEIATNLGHYDVMRRIVTRTSPRSYLEVGVRDGGSLRAVLEVRPRTIVRLGLCDTWGPVHGGTDRGSHAHIEALLKDLTYIGEVTWMDGRSDHWLPRLPPHPRYDVVLSDGDHSESCTLNDLVWGWRLTARTLVQHDTKMESVKLPLMAFTQIFSEDIDVCEFSGDTGTTVIVRRGMSWAW